MKWFDSALGALNDAAAPLQADGFIGIETSSGVLFDPPLDSRRGSVFVEVVYSETRDQYRATKHTQSRWLDIEPEVEPDPHALRGSQMESER